MGVSGVGGSGFYESHGSQPSQNQNLIDAKAILDGMSNPFTALAEAETALNKLARALNDPTLTPEQREHTQKAYNFIVEAMRRATERERLPDTDHAFSDYIRKAQNEVNLALEA